VKAATEKRGFEKGLLGQPSDDERSWVEQTLLLVVLLMVSIRDKDACGRLAGLIGNSRGAGRWPSRLSEAIDSRTSPSLQPALDVGGVMGISAGLLNFRGCGMSGFEGD
jgi:hypothetical protein